MYLDAELILSQCSHKCVVVTHSHVTKFLRLSSVVFKPMVIKTLNPKMSQVQRVKLSNQLPSNEFLAMASIHK